MSAADWEGDAGLVIDRATAADVPGILALEAREATDGRGPMLIDYPRAELAAVIAELPCIVARRSGRVVAFLIAVSTARARATRRLGAMLAVHPGRPDAYVYGPICVDPDERGRGLAAALFAALRQRLPGREGVLFIRADNAASLRAHAKMGMRPVGEFFHDGRRHVILSFVG